MDGVKVDIENKIKERIRILEQYPTALRSPLKRAKTNGNSPFQGSAEGEGLLLDEARVLVRGSLQNDQQIFQYIYAVLHLPEYRTRYAEKLKTDFPRIPMPQDLVEFDLLKNSPLEECPRDEVFLKLSTLGKKLIDLHLLKDPIFEQMDKWNFKMVGDNWKVETVKFEDDKVWINKTSYWQGISEEIWQHKIGAYQPLDKWLKDRKKPGITLTLEDKIHYCKMIISIQETQKLLK